MCQKSRKNPPRPAGFVQAPDVGPAGKVPLMQFTRPPSPGPIPAAATKAAKLVFYGAGIVVGWTVILGVYIPEGRWGAAALMAALQVFIIGGFVAVLRSDRTTPGKGSDCG